MVATAQDVGVFLRSLYNGSLLNEDEQAIYSSIYEYAGYLDTRVSHAITRISMPSLFSL